MTEQELRSRLENLTGEIPAETHRAFLSAASLNSLAFCKICHSSILFIILLVFKLNNFLWCCLCQSAEI